MRRLSQLLIGLLFIFYVNAHAALPNNDHPTTTIGPILRASFTNPLTDTSGYSFAGEAGWNAYRLGGSVGWQLWTKHRLKFSAEYLWQKITYAFFDGNLHRGENQSAFGLGYEYDASHLMRFKPLFDLSIYYSQAAGDSVGTDTGFMNTAGTISYTDIQRVSSSNTSGVAPGVSIFPWWGTKAGINLNYDNVRYNMRYESKPDVRGLGGTLHLQQFLTDKIALQLSAAFRKPYNHYQADIGWNLIPYYGAWAVKLGGGYIIGKHQLPTTYMFGLAIDYSLDMKCDHCRAIQAEDFVSWLAKPAVYMPQVLGIPDEQVTTT